ncbi:MAG: flagellar biosynthesis anti-sigma factor FlgM [Agarilytica sp.]
MVIDPGNNINSQAASSSKSRQQTASKVAESTVEQKPTSPSAEDSVSLSSASLAIGKVETEIAQASDIDSAKVASVKAQIDSGNYRIDIEAIAGKIAQEESHLG